MRRHPASGGKESVMSETDNIRVAEEYMEVLNAHDYARMKTYHGEGFRFQALGVPGRGDEAAYQVYMQRNWTAFPDLTFEAAQTTKQGKYVVQNWIGTATHDGPLTAPSGEELPATGRTGTTAGSSTMKFENGKIVLVDIYFDVLTLLADMGVSRRA
jgi:steroid delta-isomerase-like uncharacterized protein